MGESTSIGRHQADSGVAFDISWLLEDVRDCLSFVWQQPEHAKTHGTSSRGV